MDLTTHPNEYQTYNHIWHQKIQGSTEIKYNINIKLEGFQHIGNHIERTLLLSMSLKCIISVLLRIIGNSTTRRRFLSLSFFRRKHQGIKLLTLNRIKHEYIYKIKNYSSPNKTLIYIQNIELPSSQQQFPS